MPCVRFRERSLRSTESSSNAQVCIESLGQAFNTEDTESRRGHGGNPRLTRPFRLFVISQLSRPTKNVFWLELVHSAFPRRPLRPPCYSFPELRRTQQSTAGQLRAAPFARDDSFSVVQPFVRFGEFLLQPILISFETREPNRSFVIQSTLEPLGEGLPQPREGKRDQAGEEQAKQGNQDSEGVTVHLGYGVWGMGYGVWGSVSRVFIT
jgi:hypothetical protein